MGSKGRRGGVQGEEGGVQGEEGRGPSITKVANMDM